MTDQIIRLIAFNHVVIHILLGTADRSGTCSCIQRRDGDPETPLQLVSQLLGHLRMLAKDVLRLLRIVLEAVEARPLPAIPVRDILEVVPLQVVDRAELAEDRVHIVMY